MRDLTIGWDDIMRHLHPDSLIGAVVYLLIAVLIAQLLSRALRIAVRGVLARQSHLDRTTVICLQQFGIAVSWVVMLILYAHLIPVLRSLAASSPGWMPPARHSSCASAVRHRPNGTRSARNCWSSWRNASPRAGWTARTAGVRVSPRVCARGTWTPILRRR